MATGSAQPFMRASGPGGRTGTGTAGDVIGTSTQQRTTHLAPQACAGLGTDRAIQLNLTLNGTRASSMSPSSIKSMMDSIDMGVSALSAARSATTRSAQAAHSPADLPHTGIPSSVWHVTLVW